MHRPTHVLVRGDVLRLGEAVTPNTPAVLPPLTAAQEPPTRLDLARWLVDPANPLTSRVEVNRIWQQLFGRALVVSPADFGLRGEPPTHPELLDWLASEFIRLGSCADDIAMIRSLHTEQFNHHPGQLMMNCGAPFFGRTPLGENRRGREANTGRDHHPFAFTVWMAGAGVQGGQIIGETDEIGWNITKDPVHINDFHATLLHLFGLDHELLTYRFQGRDFRLTDVAGSVIRKLV